MKRYLVLISALLFLFGMSGIANATITYDYGTYGNEFISLYEGSASSLTLDFEYWEGASSGDNWALVSGSAAGYSAPMGVDGLIKDTSRYLTVPLTLDTTEPIYNTFDSDVTGLVGNYNYFGLWWGSIDLYNTLEFFNGAALVATITGAEVSSATGNQTIYDTNKYVNIFFGAESFDRFTLTSTQYAFEVDNITVAAVPEPATMMLLGFGLVGLAGIGRKLKK